MGAYSTRATASAAAAALCLLLPLQLLAAGGARAADRVYPDAGSVEPLEPGDRVPAATLRTVGGDPVSLADVLRAEGALLIFYRGGW
ncbi:MAG: hypothetical protein ACQGVK_09380 [Myxococcota bacterium]